jgi:hypothetical protein
MTNSRLVAAYMGMASQVEAGAEEHPSG